MWPSGQQTRAGGSLCGVGRQQETHAAGLPRRRGAEAQQTWGRMTVLGAGYSVALGDFWWTFRDALSSQEGRECLQKEIVSYTPHGQMRVSAHGQDAVQSACTGLRHVACCADFSQFCAPTRVHRTHTYTRLVLPASNTRWPLWNVDCFFEIPFYDCACFFATDLCTSKTANQLVKALQLVVLVRHTLLIGILDIRCYRNL